MQDIDLKTYKVIIPGRLPNLNDYTTANRSNAYKGSKMKRDAQRMIEAVIRVQLRTKITKPVFLEYTFYEKNRRRDHDNVAAFAHKVIQDALVNCGIIKDDGWDEVVGDSNSYYVDKNHPRIELTIKEVNE